MKKITKSVILLFAVALLTLIVACTQSANEFTVKFLVDGEVVKTETVAKGEDAEGLIVTKEGHYFVNWDKKITNVQSDLEVNAVFAANEYVVTFYDDYGNFIENQFIEYGQSAKAPTMNDRDNAAFIGWDKDITCIKENMEVRAMYQYTCTISYYDGNEELYLKPTKYISGNKLELPIPTKEGYEFIGWFLSDISLTPYFEIDDNFKTDLKLYARWVQVEQTEEFVLPESTYKFSSINKIKHSSGDFYVYQPQLPAGATTGATNYDWSTSDPSVASVSQWSSISVVSAGYCVLTATLKTDPNYTINCVIKVTSDGVVISSEEEANTFELCVVTFKDKDGSVISTAKCPKNGSVIYPTPTEYEGYKFVGWDKDNFNITEDTVITAQYEEGTNKYQGKTFAIIGDSISTFKGYIPEGFSYFYPYPTADVNDVNLTWWMQAINNVGGSLLVNNSYSGTCVGDSSSYATKNKSRLEYTLLSGVAPDVIIIYMGSNDCASKYVSKTDFSRGYKQMLDNLKKLCPESEIILCQLATSPFYETEEQLEYNEVIASYGEQYNLEVFDLSSVSLHGKLVDSAHPMSAGMNAVADKVTELLLKEDE